MSVTVHNCVKVCVWECERNERVVLWPLKEGHTIVNTTVVWPVREITLIHSSIHNMYLCVSLHATSDASLWEKMNPANTSIRRGTNQTPQPPQQWHRTSCCFSAASPMPWLPTRLHPEGWPTYIHLDSHKDTGSSLPIKMLVLNMLFLKYYPCAILCLLVHV